MTKLQICTVIAALAAGALIGIEPPTNFHPGNCLGMDKFVQPDLVPRHSYTVTSKKLGDRQVSFQEEPTAQELGYYVDLAEAGVVDQPYDDGIPGKTIYHLIVPGKETRKFAAPKPLTKQQRDQYATLIRKGFRDDDPVVATDRPCTASTSTLDFGTLVKRYVILFAVTLIALVLAKPRT